MDRDVEASIIPVIQSLGSSLDDLATEKDEMEPAPSELTSTAVCAETQTAKIENSTNKTNAGVNSLTHSQVSIISKSNQNEHLYSTPESVKNDATKVIVSRVASKDDILERHSMAKKSMLSSSLHSSPAGVIMQQTKGKTKIERFPVMVALGALQLVLSIVLAALGGLVIARDASMSLTFSGIWAGAIAGIAGSLAILNVKAARTGFLAASLISVASGTLAASFTGIGLVRDWNVVHQDPVI